MNITNFSFEQMRFDEFNIVKVDVAKFTAEQIGNYKNVLFYFSLALFILTIIYLIFHKQIRKILETKMGPYIMYSLFGVKKKFKYNTYYEMLFSSLIVLEACLLALTLALIFS